MALPSNPSIAQLQRVHPHWLDRREQWAEIQTVRRNDRAEMMQHLVRGVLESTAEWEKRRKLTRFAPESINARHGFVGEVMDCEPNRDRLPPPLKQWTQGVDRHGRSLTDWIEQKALPCAADFGAVFGLVDTPRLSVQPRNLAEQRAAGGLQVILSAFTPMQVRNWSVDSRGELEWVVVVTDVALAPEPFAPRIPMRRYLLLDSSSFVVVHTRGEDGELPKQPRWKGTTGEPGEADNAEEQVVQALTVEGSHGCDRVPLVPFIVDPEDDLVGRSLIRNAVQLDLRRYNHESDQAAAFHSHGHPQLTLRSRKGPRDLGVGVDHVVHLDPEGDESLQYVQLDATSFDQRRAEIDQARRDIHRHTGGDPMTVADDGGSTASGKARQVSARNTVGRHVKRMRTGIAAFEDALLELAGSKLGVPFDRDEHGVSYPTRFLQETDLEVIETTTMASKNTRSPDAQVELELRMLDQVLPGLSTDVRTKITEQVRSLPRPSFGVGLFPPDQQE